MTDYQKERMFHNGVELPVSIVISLAENAPSDVEANSYLLSLLWHAGETGDKDLRRICNNIRMMKCGMPFSLSPASVNNLPCRRESSEPTSQKIELNYFQPQKHLSAMLCGDWFVKNQTNSMFTNKWTNNFVADLLKSEYGDLIATEWAKRGKLDRRDYIRGSIVGLLKEAGVLKGSNLAIARTYLGIREKTRDEELKKKVNTFANYMGKGRKEPYADWVMEYVDKSLHKG